MNKKINGKTGFTLIELMVAVAIIGILAGVVLVQMQGYAKDARATKAIAQLSSVIPSMYSCWGNGGKVNVPGQNGGADVCSTNPSYGKWPNFTSDMDSYDFTVSVENDSNQPDYCASPGCINKDAWYVYVDSNSDNKRICCNLAMKSCKADISGSQCTAAVPSN
ncbi:MAG: hypothetical protein UX02_C0001G0019 [Candidatus Moranbacteria bacterium GW2011_GWC1_45_18]|nr:MAG: hypothetical protein UT79_C0002G0378 [Candidatus Moranbacteria bacterium GW2011_GWC2_40_12]KKT34219.1 MAG: hypothetical protein UW19_C0001G0114 [Candidatus Moranbacteria bacterium GW2011_GWF2_44_10]KKU00571.1 MAG: hypothetical protein UX02_C0001G0019 [Candidatus Moranbacteria bacterium GW2011_GWC1_45_18]OGI24418.1 MAG: hypothetical protein A2194_05065 [Candidatus Moranbacteria bacterium RIFOXYA1_FULL_44_8]OGI36205.1 MAG: hypothetical protein A2407_03930 [Candidatus Moranbacteria bacteri